MCTIVKLNSPLQARAHVFCFHWAGGTGIAFKPLGKFIEASNLCAYGITLPGRNGRGTNSMYRSIGDIITGLLPEFIKFVEDNSCADVPIIFFGHSFGGIVAFELARSLEKAGSDILSSIIISAVRSPSTLTENNTHPTSVFHYRQTDAQLTQYMNEIGGKDICL